MSEDTAETLQERIVIEAAGLWRMLQDTERNWQLWVTDSVSRSAQDTPTEPEPALEVYWYWAPAALYSNSHPVMSASELWVRNAHPLDVQTATLRITAQVTPRLPMTLILKHDDMPAPARVFIETAPGED